MSGISTGVGLFSGIDTQQLIGQLLAVEARPKQIIQRRILQLQGQQAAYLDINTRLNALKDAAAKFRVGRTFDTKKAVSSDPDVLSAAASASAAAGTYAFIVDQLVTSQRLLSRGFTSNTGGIGATAFTFEADDARLDRDARLADLNGGEGVSRGKIVITETGGGSATVDLSRAATIGEVVDAINAATGINVTAAVVDDHLVVTQNGGLNISITNSTGYTTATSLGIERSAASSATVTGTEIHRLGNDTALSLLNDGNGVYINDQGGTPFDFEIKYTPSGGSLTTVKVNLGNVYDGATLVDGPVNSIGGVLERINEALADAGVTGVSASVTADGASLQIVETAGTGSIELVDNALTLGDTLADLGFASGASNLTGTGTLTGKRILAGMDSTLARSLNGGTGLSGDGSISITTRDGTARTVTIDRFGTLEEILAEFASDTGGAVTAALDDRGTGIVITDTTGGTSNLIVSGTTAAALGIDTDPGGVASSTVAGGDLEHQYVTMATPLASLNGGTGIGTGRFRITDSTGATHVFELKDSVTRLDGLIKLINGASGIAVKARINAGGDGVELYETGTGGTLEFKVEDISGNVAGRLGIEGEASAAGAAGTIDGSFEREVEFEATDGLDEIARKINEAGVGVSAAVINDGAGSTPFRLSLTATTTGTAGRFLVDTGSLDLNLAMLDAGRDARVFFGSTDPAQGVLLSSSTNSLDSVITGVTIDLNSVSEEPVNLTITRDTAAIETAVGDFVKSFNDLVDRIDLQTRYIPDTNTRGPLLGDSTAITLRGALFSTVQGEGIGLSGTFQELADVGVTVGSGGELQLDRDRLRAALEEDAQAVADLFAARVLKPKEPIQISSGITAIDPDAKDEFLTLGVAGRLEELAKSYTASVDGILSGRSRTLTDQIEAQNRRITAFDERLEVRRQVLQRQFLAMERAIGQLQSQQGALSQISMVG